MFIKILIYKIANKGIRVLKTRYPINPKLSDKVAQCGGAM